MTTMSVSDDVANGAFYAVEQHPLYTEARAWAYCASDIFSTAKNFIGRTKNSDADKTRIDAALADVETVLWVGYMTSDKEPEPLCSGGKHYLFVVHPQTFVVLHLAIGTWRS